MGRAQGPEAQSDFGRGKATLGFRLGHLSINLQVPILPDMHRARETLYPGPGGLVQRGRLKQGGEGMDPRSPRKPGKERWREGTSILPLVPPYVAKQREAALDAHPGFETKS